MDIIIPRCFTLHIYKNVSRQVYDTQKGLGIMKEILNGVKNQSSYERFEVSWVKEDRYVVARLLVS